MVNVFINVSASQYSAIKYAFSSLLKNKQTEFDLYDSYSKNMNFYTVKQAHLKGVTITTSTSLDPVRSP